MNGESRPFENMSQKQILIKQNNFENLSQKQMSGIWENKMQRFVICAI